MNKISDIIKNLESIKNAHGDIEVIADTSWSPDVKATINDYIIYTGEELDNMGHYVNSVDDEKVLCIRIK